MVYIRSDRVQRWSPAAFKRARAAAGLNFATIAERLGVGTSTVQGWSAHSKPPTVLLAQIARVLGVKKEELLESNKSR